MHLLLIALNYYPDMLGNAPLMTGLCEDLVKRGHRVSVVCSFPHHETGRIEERYRGHFIQREQRNGVEILRMYLYPPKDSTLAKMASYASFTISALVGALSIRDVDVILTPSPPITLGFLDGVLKTMRGVPFVYNLQDLFPEAAIQLGVLTNRYVIRFFKTIERYVISRADCLAVISEGFRNYLARQGVPDRKITVIPNYADTELIVPEDPATNKYRHELNLQGRFIVQFSGRMGHSQDFDTVIRVMKILSDLPNLHFMMVGDGHVRTNLERSCHGLHNITFLPVQLREDLSALLSAADIGLSPLRKGLSSTSVPSKIFGIMAAARPVVACADKGSDTEEIICTAGGGLVVEPGDAAALAWAIRRLYMNRELALSMGNRGRDYVVRYHNRESIVNQYENLLMNIAENR